MKIKRIYIENFRSIKKLSFEPNNLCALVGPNSAGKTNILKAIDLVLGEGWTTKAKVAKELFFDLNKTIKIELFFENSLPYPSGNGFTTNVNSIELEMSFNPEFSAKTTINGYKPFYHQDIFKSMYQFIYISADRNLNGELRVSEWTMLGKMMRKIHENYSNFYGGEENLKEEFVKIMEEPTKFLEEDFDSESITFYKFVDTFGKYCGKNSIGLANDFKPELNIYNLNWFYKTLQIHLKEEFSEKVFNANDVGSGMQNLLLISIFQTYASLMGGNVIFGIEEPEIYLYPQAQRGLYKSFQELSKDTQIFYTTHSQNFVDGYRAYEVELCNKNINGTYITLKNTKILNKVLAEKERFRIYTHFNTDRNELFFAKKIIFVEGDSDKILLSILAEKWGFDLDNLGISIIECGGKQGVLYFIGVAELLGLTNYFAIWDKDNDIDDKFEIFKNTLKGNKGLEFTQNLEDYINKEHSEKIKIGGNKVENAFNWANSIDISMLGSSFNFIREFISGEQKKEYKTDNITFTEDLPF